jgi:transmembrane sensor
MLLATAALATYMLTSSGVYATSLGEQRSLALSDSSTVQLNSLSKIRVRYSERERTVDLLQGQALFHVAKDPTRPFIVHIGQTLVRAVGTQFDVYRKADGTIVTVVEGRIAILNEGNPSGPRHEDDFLTAGEQITVSPKIARKTLHPNLAGATSWTQRQLVFDSASFADVAEEFNRYNERKLVMDASALDNLHISGVFSSTDPASLIRFLRDRPGLRVTETPTQIRVEGDP